MKRKTYLKNILKTYISPAMEVQYIYIEQSIAANSATVTPVNSSNQVQQEWETGDDVNRDLLW